MKKLLLIATYVLIASVTLHAQRYAVIDTKYILNKMQDYKDADKKLAQISEPTWASRGHGGANFTHCPKQLDCSALSLHCKR